MSRRYPERGNDGYRGKLERAVGHQLKAIPVHFGYEPGWIPYRVPARTAKYLPDFVLPNGIVIETKGIFDAPDRQKHLLLKEQYPDLDVRFVFSRLLTPIYPKSKTTVADWCAQHGFECTQKLTPEAWIKEPMVASRVRALMELGVILPAWKDLK